MRHVGSAIDISRKASFEQAFGPVTQEIWSMSDQNLSNWLSINNKD